MKAIAVIVPLIVALAGMGIGLYAAYDPESAFKILEDIGPEKIAIYLPIIIIVITVLIIIAAFLPMIKMFSTNFNSKKLLMERGQKKTVKILSVQDTGMSINNNPYITVTVETSPGVQATFQMKASRINVPRPGDIMEILYDPANPSVVVPANE